MTIRTTAQITAAVLVACVLLLLLVVFDLYMAANNVPGDTISEVVRSWAARHPVIPFAAGVVMGHFFW